MIFVNKMAGVAFGTLLFGFGLVASGAQAGVVITLREVGNDVVATASGVLDLTGLSFFDSNSYVSNIDPINGTLITGTAFPDTAPIDTWVIGFPDPIGSGSIKLADSGTGDIVGVETIQGRPPLLVVPQGYAANDPLSGTATWNNASFKSLGVGFADGASYFEMQWGVGVNQNFAIDLGFYAGPLPVPEPASITLLGVALAGLLRAGTIRRCLPQD